MVYFGIIAYCHCKTRSPFILKDIKAVWGHIWVDEYGALLFHAVMLVTFFGSLYISKLGARFQWDTLDRVLRLQDLCLVEGFLDLVVCQSKMDQLQKGGRIVIGPGQSSIYAP